MGQNSSLPLPDNDQPFQSTEYVRPDGRIWKVLTDEKGSRLYENNKQINFPANADIHPDGIIDLKTNTVLAPRVGSNLTSSPYKAATFNYEGKDYTYFYDSQNRGFLAVDGKHVPQPPNTDITEYGLVDLNNNGRVVGRFNGGDIPKAEAPVKPEAVAESAGHGSTTARTATATTVPTSDASTLAASVANDGDIVPIKSPNGKNIIGYEVTQPDGTKMRFTNERAAHLNHNAAHANENFELLAGSADGFTVTNQGSGNPIANVWKAEDGLYYVNDVRNGGEVHQFNSRAEAKSFVDNMERSAGQNNGGSGAPSKNATGDAAPRPKLRMQDKVMGFASIGLLTYGAYEMFANGVSGKAVASLAVSSFMTVMQFRQTLEAMGWGNPMILGAFVGGAILTGWLLSLIGPKKDNESGPGGLSNPSASQPIQPSAGEAPLSWSSWLPEQSIFYILASVATIAIGAQQLNLNPASETFIPNSRIRLNSDQMPAAINELKKDTGRSSLPSNLVGKVFIKKGDGTSTPDVAVFLSPNGNGDGGFTLNKVAMDRAGDLISPATPNNSFLPFWLVERQTGTITPNPPAFEAVTTQMAMAEAANSGASPTSQRNAVDIGTASGHDVVESNN